MFKSIIISLLFALHSFAGNLIVKPMSCEIKPDDTHPVLNIGIQGFSIDQIKYNNVYIDGNVMASNHFLNITGNLPLGRFKPERVGYLIMSYSGNGLDLKYNVDSNDGLFKTNIVYHITKMTACRKNVYGLNFNDSPKTLISNAGNLSSYKSKDGNGVWLIPEKDVMLKQISKHVDNVNSNYIDTLIIVLAGPSVIQNDECFLVDNFKNKIDKNLIYDELNKIQRGKILCIFCTDYAERSVGPEDSSIDKSKNIMIWCSNDKDTRYEHSDSTYPFINSIYNTTSEQTMTYKQAIERVGNDIKSSRFFRYGLWNKDHVIDMKFLK